MRMNRRILFGVACCGLASALAAADLYVDAERGRDDWTGRSPAAEAPAGPKRTVDAAIALAEPGDTVHLIPGAAPWRQSATFKDKAGLPGKPITLDGHGAVLSGAVRATPADWVEVEPGLYENTVPGQRLGVNQFNRMFLILGNRKVGMGRTTKGRSPAWPDKEALKPGEWRIDRERKAFQLRLAPNVTPAGAGLELPHRGAGVSLGGVSRHLLIRNLTAIHCWNDGFNIHDDARDIRFENIRAFENGDDGISAHEACAIEIDGLVAAGNSTGLCHINQTRTVTKNAFLFDNSGYDIFVLDESGHDMENVVVLSSGREGVAVAGRARLTMRNVLLARLRGADASLAVRGGELAIHYGRLAGWSVAVGAEGKLTLADCVAPAPDGFSPDDALAWAAHAAGRPPAAFAPEPLTFALERADALILQGGRLAAGRIAVGAEVHENAALVRGATPWPKAVFLATP